MFECVKSQKRLWIREIASGKLIYTPPSFIKLKGRDPMHDLAARFSLKGSRDIESIIDFETLYGPNK